MLRFPGTLEHFWVLNTPEGLKKFEVSGPYDSDDGDVVTGWALAGHGIINKPRFDIEPFIRGRPAEGGAGSVSAAARATGRRLSAQELPGPESPPAARLHGRSAASAMIREILAR